MTADRSTQNPPSRRALLWVVLLVGVAALLRVWRLGGESLWLDEALTWWNVTRPTWQATALSDPNHGPVWWLITRAFVLGLGDSEFALRAPAAILGILSVPLAWLLARRLLDPAGVPAAAGFHGLDAGAPLWVAALAVIHPLWIEYSQEARMYSALLAASLGLSLLFLSWLRTGRRRTLTLYAGLAALALYTHHLAALTLLAHTAFFVIESVRRRARGERPVAFLSLLLAQACAVVVFLPWLLRSLQIGAGVHTQGHFGRFERAGFALWRLMFGPSLASIDRPRADAGPILLLHEETPILLLGTTLALLALLAGIRALRRDAPARNFVVTSILTPFLILFLIFPRYPLLHEKYLLMTAPYLLILAVFGARAAAGTLRPLLLSGLFVLTLLGAAAYCFPEAPAVAALVVHGHPRGKEQWREARAWVAERAGPDDAILLYPAFLRMPWAYYDRERLRAVELPRTPASREELAGILGGQDRQSRLFLVSAAARSGAREALVRDLSRWSAPPDAPPDSGLVGSHLFPRQWGVWVYEFRGIRGAGLPGAAK